MTTFLIGAAIVLVAMLVGSARARAAFEQHFPPISDAEFLARCRPGTDPEVALKVRRVVARHFGVEYEQVHPSTSFIDDLGAD